MTDVTAQAFREAAMLAETAARESEECPDPLCELCEPAAIHHERARLLLAAAEQREAHDRVMTKAAERLGQQEAAMDQLEAEIATLTAERDEARAKLATTTALLNQIIHP